MLLTGWPVAFSQNKNCVCTGRYQKYGEKEFPDSLYQNLPLNLDTILTTFQFHNAFAIEISDAFIFCLVSLCFLMAEILSNSD